MRLLERYGAETGSSKKLRSAQARVRALTVAFKEKCTELANAPARQIVTAFVTFETRRQRDAVFGLYQDRGWLLSALCQKRGLYFRAKVGLLLDYPLCCPPSTPPLSLFFFFSLSLLSHHTRAHSLSRALSLSLSLSLSLFLYFPRTRT